MSEEENKVEAPVVPETPVEPEKFIGSGKVVKMETRDNGFVHYELDSGIVGLVKSDQYDNMVKGAAYDGQMVMVLKWSPVTAQILKLLLDYQLPMSDMNFVSKQMQQSIVDNYEKACSKLFKRQSTDHVRISQIDEVLKTNTDLIIE